MDNIDSCSLDHIYNGVELISVAELVLATRNQTADITRFFISEVESVLDTRHQTADITKFFISEVETVLETRNQTTGSAKFFFIRYKSLILKYMNQLSV